MKKYFILIAGVCVLSSFGWKHFHGAEAGDNPSTSLRVTEPGNNPSTPLIVTESSTVPTGSVTAYKMAASDLKKVHDYYNSNPSITVDTYYMAFEDHQSQQITEGKYGMMMRSKEACYTKILHIETLAEKDMIINVDHQDKLMIVGDNNTSSVDPLSLNLDSLMLFCTAIDYKNVGTERKYSFDFSDNDFSEYDKMELTIDTKNYRFTKIALFFRAAMNLSGDYTGQEKQPRMEILYKNYKKTIVNPALMEKKNYLTEVNGKLNVSAKYKDYTVSDLRKKTRFKGRS